MFYLFSSFLLIAAFGWFASRRLLTYLHFFQQEEYDEDRFLNWIWKNKVFDRKVSAALFVIGIGSVFVAQEFLIVPLMIAALGGFAIIENDPRKNSKKRLNMTPRAQRIFYYAVGIATAPAILAFVTKTPFLYIILIQLIPLSLGIATRYLQKEEEEIQQKYWNEAHEKVKHFQPTVIGITGSFGKTSIKHILGHILSLHAPTLMTPGSVNTPMGNTRVIRDELNEDHKYFVVEMGAYGHGSIARLCDLTPPDYGIISTIGHAHYERFKSLEAVAETKFELARAVIKNGDGKVIVEEKTLKFPYSKTLETNHKEQFVVCGDHQDNKLVILNVYQAKDGVEVKVRWGGKAYTLKAPLYGSHHGENMALCFAMACTLGMEPKDVITALRTVPQIRHRLEVKKTSGLIGAVIIDDAYNSNPRGFRTGLDLLTLLAGNKHRRIVITPGMVELGASHDRQHAELGEYAAANSDMVLVVQPERIPTFVEAFERHKREDQSLLKFETFAAAEDWVNHNMRTGDVILIENDLPDLYERIPEL